MKCGEVVLTLAVITLLGGWGASWSMEKYGDIIGFMALYFILASAYLIWRFTRPVRKCYIAKDDERYIYLILYPGGRVSGACANWDDMYFWLMANYPQYVSAFLIQYPKFPGSQD